VKKEVVFVLPEFHDHFLHDCFKSVYSRKDKRQTPRRLRNFLLGVCNYIVA